MSNRNNLRDTKTMRDNEKDRQREKEIQREDDLKVFTYLAPVNKHKNNTWLDCLHKEQVFISKSEKGRF